MSQRRFEANSNNLNNPLGEESVFYVHYEDMQNSPLVGTIDPKKQYTYTVIHCDSGVEVFEKYNSGTYIPDTRQIYIFIEKKDSSKSNFFGTACRVLMGDERKILMRQLLNRSTRISVNDRTQLATSLQLWAKQLADNYRGTSDEIDAKMLIEAVRLELANQSEVNKVFQRILGLNNQLADWIKSGVGVMDNWKFKPENYEYGKYGKDLKPLIPVNIRIPNTYQLQKVSGRGSSRLTQLATNLDKVIFNKTFITTAVAITPNKLDDLLLFLTEALTEQLPEVVKTIFTKTKAIIQSIGTFIKEIGKVAEEGLALLNAFLCGIVNGIISLLQMVVWLIAFIIDNISLLELENFSRTKIAEQQQKLEFLEDLIDVIDIDLTSFFTGLGKNIKSLPNGILQLSLDIGTKVAGFSRFFWAYIIGNVAFELILDAVIAFFTGGTSLAASAVMKISRITAKTGPLAIKGVKAVASAGRRAAQSTAQFLQWLKLQIKGLVDALTNGTLVNLIRAQLDELFGLGLRAKEILTAFGKALLNFFDNLGLALAPVKALELSSGHRYLVLKSGDEIIRGTKEVIVKFAASLKKIPPSARAQYLDELAGTSKGVFHLGGKKIVLKSEILDFIKDKGLKIVRKPKATKTLDIIDSNGITIFRSLPDDIAKYYKFARKTASERKSLISAMKKILASNSRKYKPNKATVKGYDIPKSKNGTSPDFDNKVKHLYKNNPNSAKVKIKVTGSRDMDFLQANKALGLKSIPKGYTWHHLDDLDEGLGCTMQLVKTTVHRATFQHLGSAKQFQELLGIKKYLT